MKALPQGRAPARSGACIVRNFAAMEFAGFHLLPLGFGRSPRGSAQDLGSPSDDSEVQHGRGSGFRGAESVPGATGSRREPGHLPPRCPALPHGAGQQGEASPLQSFPIP